MRLVKLQLRGFRRFKEASVNLEADVLALVGPNEAGKTSVLHALSSLETDDPFEKSDLTDRRETDDDKVIVEVRYLLDEDERALVGEVHASGEPRWFVVRKTRIGEVQYATDPQVGRNLDIRAELRNRLQAVLNHTHYRRVLKAPLAVPRGNKEPDDTRTLQERFTEAVSALESDKQMLPRAVRQDLEESLKLFGEQADQISEHSRAVAQRTITQMQRLSELEDRHPRRVLHEQLKRRRPRVLLFTSAHRSFRNVYERTEVTEKQAALTNLLHAGGSSPHEVRSTMVEGDKGRMLDLETRLNETLRGAFDPAWRQSGVYPKFNVNEESLELHVEHPVRGHSLVAYQSDGLKAFVALFAFTLVQAPDVAPVLLVDEAEQHLHYDAQADLIGMFYRQEAAAQIIYTTHSAGCLPHDLGMGVRVVEPIDNDEGDDTGYSRLKTRFWGEGAGYTPLLLAMGASALAFAPARRALMVVGEGGTETILLPTLFDEVSDGQLDFQVLPGIANIARDQIPDLDLEAPRVVYLVDGDSGGRQNRRNLEAGDIPRRRIFQLPRGCTSEDLVALDVYVEAVNKELYRSGHAERVQVADLRTTGRVEKLDEWCASVGVPVPKKAAVAERIVEQRAERALTSDTAARHLRDLLSRIREALRLPRDVESGTETAGEPHE